MSRAAIARLALGLAFALLALGAPVTQAGGLLRGVWSSLKPHDVPAFETEVDLEFGGTVTLRQSGESALLARNVAGDRWQAIPVFVRVPPGAGLARLAEGCHLQEIDTRGVPSGAAWEVQLLADVRADVHFKVRAAIASRPSDVEFWNAPVTAAWVEHLVDSIPAKLPWKEFAPRIQPGDSGSIEHRLFYRADSVKINVGTLHEETFEAASFQRRFGEGVVPAIELAEYFGGAEYVPSPLVSNDALRSSLGNESLLCDGAWSDSTKNWSVRLLRWVEGEVVAVQPGVEAFNALVDAGPSTPDSEPPWQLHAVDEAPVLLVVRGTKQTPALRAGKRYRLLMDSGEGRPSAFQFDMVRRSWPLSLVVGAALVTGFLIWSTN